MNAAQRLQALGQSLWLDNLTRDMLEDGILRGYMDQLAVTGLTSNPSTFAKATAESRSYAEAIARLSRDGLAAEQIFIELALDDIRRAADMFRPIFDRTDGVDGWVSLEVSPLLARDTTRTLTEARELHRRADRPNVLIKIPGTPEGLPAIEEAIFCGVPINVTLLFSVRQYRAAAEAFTRGIERRAGAGLNPNVGSVASIFVSRWDAAVVNRVPAELRNRLGLAVARCTYREYRTFIASPRWQRLYNRGGRPQRLLFASTGTKDPAAPPLLYAAALVAPLTVDTVPDVTLKALAESKVVEEALPPDGGDCDAELERFTGTGVDLEMLAEALQRDGVEKFVESWRALIGTIGKQIEKTERRRFADDSKVPRD